MDEVWEGGTVEFLKLPYPLVTIRYKVMGVVLKLCARETMINNMINHRISAKIWTLLYLMHSKTYLVMSDFMSISHCFNWHSFVTGWKIKIHSFLFSQIIFTAVFLVHGYLQLFVLFVRKNIEMLYYYVN